MQELYRRLLEFTGDGVYRYAYEDGRILNANQGFVDILDLGCAPEQVVGRFLHDILVYVEKAGSIRDLLEPLGEIHGFEYHFRTLKGEDRWVIHDSFLVSDRKTGEKVVEAIVKDITVRKKAEQEIAAERERLAVTMRSIGDAVIATDTAGRIQEFNQVAEVLTGWSHAEAVGRPLGEVFRIVNEDTHEPCENPVEKVLRSGVVVGLANHTALIHREGAHRSIADSGAPIRDREGRIIGVVLVFRDVTEHRRVEESLREYRDRLEDLVKVRTGDLTEANDRLGREVQERKTVEQNLRAALEREQAAAQSLVESELQYRTILRTAMDGFWLTDLKGKFLDVNDAYCALTGYTREEVLRMTIRDVEVAETPAQTEKRIRDLIQAGSSRFETCHRHKDGRTIDIEVSVNHSPGHGGRFFCFLRDISERKRIDARLGSLMARLARSNTELEQFAYVASHDLQEPLRKIQAFGERLQAACAAQLTDQGKDYVARMQNAAGRMGRLINDLLAFSRLTSRGAPFVPVDLQRAAGEVLGDLDLRLQQSGGRVDVGPLPTLDADPTQMGQLLQNLIANALKFHKPGVPPMVQVRAETLTLDGREVCRLAVADNGIGFDEKYLDRIFVIFQQLHPRGEYEGTGIGLAVCRKIVERHGGTLTARSQPGEGATFIVDLPLRQDKGQETKE